MAKRKKLILKVVFDTNAIYNESESYLLQEKIGKLIDNHSALPDLEIIWCLPNVVLNERIYQMINKGKALLQPIQKLEKLLGHNLNITDAIIERRVKDVVQEQVAKYNILELKLEPVKVDWNRLISDSVFRIAPFEGTAGKEKGFRDAIIIECLMQAIENSPISKDLCRIILVTDDGLLTNAVNQRTSHLNNVSVLPNVNELIGQINILSSQISEELINSITPMADDLFLIIGNNSSIYYKEKVRDKIEAKFSKELNIKYDGATKRVDESWTISKPSFEKKINQRIYWKTVLAINFTCSKIAQNDTVYESRFADLILPKPNYMGQEINTIEGLAYMRGLNPLREISHSPIDRLRMPISAKEEKLADGKTRFEIIWSVTLTTTKKLKNPKIESINYVDTVFNQ